ncbi:MAG: twin-arginine translocase TatA/TatE family subunit [Deltaproteobacteria bacterium]|nr:twin-arginine translocase TatA/TatE family subunit [Deltaproteobacteria bacterium]
MFGLGWMELLLIFGIVVVMFGAGRLPALGQGLGQMINNFRKSMNEIEPPDKKDSGK